MHATQFYIGVDTVFESNTVVVEDNCFAMHHAVRVQFRGPKSGLCDESAIKDHQMINSTTNPVYNRSVYITREGSLEIVGNGIITFIGPIDNHGVLNILSSGVIFNSTVSCCPTKSWQYVYG